MTRTISRDQLPSLNSATKYPSIPTYHALGDRGRLTEELSVDFHGETVYLTEKVDGTNSRVIFLPDGDYFIGSRDQLLHAKGDFVFNDTLNIVETIVARSQDLPDLMERIAVRNNFVTVLFLETFGHGIGPGKNYCGTGRARSTRLFDIAYIGADEFYGLLKMSPERVASWRDHGGLQFAAFDHVASWDSIAHVPQLAVVSADRLPKTVQETSDFLDEMLPVTKCALSDSDDVKMIPEGIVVRTNDRSKIAKMRFEDYRKTLRS